MKSGIILTALGLTALGVVACSGVAAAGDSDQAVVVKVADRVVPAPRYRRPHYVVRPPYFYEPYPVACEAVLFPRSPLCAGRPASFGYYAPYPWDHRWSY